jgi:hypothetical protein
MERMLQILDEIMDATPEEKVILWAEYDRLDEELYGWLSK